MHMKHHDKEWESCTYTAKEVRAMKRRNIATICISVAAIIISIITLLR